MRSSANVTFQVMDINEFRPRFSAASYSTVTISTAPAGTSLLQVAATDDDGEDNEITYSVINRGENGVNFTVDSDGVIRNAGPLDAAPKVIKNFFSHNGSLPGFLGASMGGVTATVQPCLLVLLADPLPTVKEGV